MVMYGHPTPLSSITVGTDSVMGTVQQRCYYKRVIEGVDFKGIYPRRCGAACLGRNGTRCSYWTSTDHRFSF